MRLTRDVTRDIGRESQTPARTCPSRPCPDRPYRSTSLWSPNIMSSSSVMPDTRDDMMTGLSTIEGIDFDAKVPCEVEDHDHDADLIAQSVCIQCGDSAALAMCWSQWARLHEYESVRCDECGRSQTPRQGYHVIEVLR